MIITVIITITTITITRNYITINGSNYSDNNNNTDNDNNLNNKPYIVCKENIYFLIPCLYLSRFVVVKSISCQEVNC